MEQESLKAGAVLEDSRTLGFCGQYYVWMKRKRVVEVVGLGRFQDILSLGRTLLAVPLFGYPGVGVNITLLIPPGPYWNGDGSIISDDFQVALKLVPLL